MKILNARDGDEQNLALVSYIIPCFFLFSSCTSNVFQQGDRFPNYIQLRA